jgi:membrane associated rhomboid family serine protease
MRRAIAYGLGVVSVPVGTGLGLWLAQLTNAPPCPVLGLGTAALCRAQPLLSPSFCVLCGGAAAAVLLLLAIVVYRPNSLVAAFDVAAAGAGILIGIWAALSVVFAYCGPGQLGCDPLGMPRYTVWESALIGAAATAAIIALGCAGSTEFRRVNLDAARRTRRWLFNDLSHGASMDGPGADAG